jgi:hypothetical protein
MENGGNGSGRALTPALSQGERESKMEGQAASATASTRPRIMSDAFSAIASVVA